MTRIHDESFRLADRPKEKLSATLLAGVKLGLRNAGTHKPRLRLADYVDRSVTPPAAISRPHPGFSWGMLANDRLGDCVCAAILHAIESWLLDTGSTAPGFTDADAILLYEHIGAYRPSDPSTDQGCDENQAMRDWKNGLPKTSDGRRHALAETIAIDPADAHLVRVAIDEFDGVFDGIDLPLSAQGQAEWDIVGNPVEPDTHPGSWGGHATYTREYDPATFSVLTWGHEILETVAFRAVYHSQAFALIPKDVQKTGIGPSGVHWDDLLSDLAKLQ